MEWKHQHETLLRAQIGDCKFQPQFEAYASPNAIAAWLAEIRDLREALIPWGDAEGVLRGVIKKKAKQPTVMRLWRRLDSHSLL